MSGKKPTGDVATRAGTNGDGGAKGDGKPRLDRSILPIQTIEHHTVTPVDARNAPPIPPIRMLTPPGGAPNVLIILIDDMGFGASSAFGGPCRMPNAERLAKEGLKFTRFHTTALCSPSRQALLTGRNHHSVNMGGITEMATAQRGYSSVRPDSAATIAHILKGNGYNTAAFGKLHQTPTWEVSSSGPFDRWPTGDGFEAFYGFLGGENNQWTPSLYVGTAPVDPPRTPEQGYHLSEDLADKCIEFIRKQRVMTPEKPFFVYLSFGATHAPHHVPKPWIDKYKGNFDEGWDKLRERTLQKQRELGVVPKDCALTKRHEEIPAWDTLSPDAKKVATRLMETYAGFAEHTDAQVGRVIDALEQIGCLENTVLFYILGDNGASAEGGLEGTFNELAALNGIVDDTANIVKHLDEIGSPLSYNHYPVGWAHAMNAPYQWTKQVASHWGGTRNGMIVHYPAGIASKGETRSQFCHVIDVLPTVLELAKVPEPSMVNGVPQQPIEGISFAYAFNDASAKERHSTQYFEMFGNRGIYHEGWTACTKHRTPWLVTGSVALGDDVWELYAPEDYSQSKNIAKERPDKLRELQQLFLIEAAQHHVLPLDDRFAERINDDIAGRPNLSAGRTSMTLYPGMTHLTEGTVVNIKNKSYSITAEIEVSSSGNDNGAIIVQGGRFGGYSLFLKDGVPCHCYNWVGLERYDMRGKAKLSPGRHTVRYEFAYDGGGVGKGGNGKLLVDGKEVASARVDKTVPFGFSSDDMMDVGTDDGAPVTEDYGPRGSKFTGIIHSVRIDLGSERHPDHEGRHQVAMARQ